MGLSIRRSKCGRGSSRSPSSACSPSLRVALLLALAAVLIGNRRLDLTVFRRFRKAAAVAALLALSTGARAQAPIPDSATLEKLRARLLEVPDAFPHAADIPFATLTLTERKVTIDAEIHAAERVAVPLPGRLPAWSPLSVLVDDQPAAALRRDDGYLWVLSEPGVHRVHVEGSLANVTEWEWTYLLKPRQVKIDAPDWTVTGVKPTGVPEAQVFFARKQKAAAGAATYDHQEVQAIVADRSQPRARAHLASPQHRHAPLAAGQSRGPARAAAPRRKRLFLQCDRARRLHRSAARRAGAVVPMGERPRRGAVAPARHAAR